MKWISLATAVLVSLFAGAMAGAQSGEEPAAPPTVVAGKLIVTVSVDWEGLGLRDEDLDACVAFQKRFRKIPLTHFLNAAYFTRGDRADAVTAMIRRVIRDGDETGLHVHCWRSLVERSGVAFRAGPRFYKGGSFSNAPEDGAGYTVELSAYSAEEVAKIVSTSRGLLVARGFKLSRSFRSGGWMASPSVLQGVREAGFTVDSSATDPSWHQDEIEGTRLQRRLGDLWGKITQHTQPFEISTPAGRILEMPDSGALADYVTADEMNRHVATALSKLGPKTHRFAHIGFHLEGCERFLPRIADCVKAWHDHPRVSFRTLAEAATLFRKQQRAQAEREQED